MSGPDQTPPLPELQQGLLDAEGLRALFADITGAAQVQEVQIKAAAAEHAGRAPSLAVAAGLLLDGQARAVQVRYVFDGREWCDTVMAHGGGFRVIRM